MSEPTFPIRLADIKKLSDAVCELDAFRPRRDCRDGCYADLVSECHAILIDALGEDVELVYGRDDGSEQAAA